MNYGKCADFFLEGLVVVWPMMLWSGNLESGVALYILLLFATICSGAMADDRPGEPL